MADDPAYRLPSLKLASDGPVQRLLEPSNDGPWSPDQAVLPWAEFHDNQVTVHNIRNAYYRTVDDYTVRLYNKTFDLCKLTSVDFIVVPFNDNPAIAHVMLSFGFEDKDYLVSSVEIRKRVGADVQRRDRFLQPVHPDVRAGRRARRDLEGVRSATSRRRFSIARRPRPSRPRRCSST